MVYIVLNGINAILFPIFQVRGNDAETEQKLPPNFVACMDANQLSSFSPKVFKNFLISQSKFLKTRERLF